MSYQCGAQTVAAVDTRTRTLRHSLEPISDASIALFTIPPSSPPQISIGLVLPSSFHQTCFTGRQTPGARGPDVTHHVRGGPRRSTGKGVLSHGSDWHDFPDPRSFLLFRGKCSPSRSLQVSLGSPDSRADSFSFLMDSFLHPSLINKLFLSHTESRQSVPRYPGNCAPGE